MDNWNYFTQEGSVLAYLAFRNSQRDEEFSDEIRYDDKGREIENKYKR